MFRTRHTLLATTLLLAACAGNDYGPSLGSVPNMPSLDNDRAVEQEAELKQARVEALSRRMDAVKEAGTVTTPAVVEDVPEAKEEAKEEVAAPAAVVKEVAAAPVIERPVINSDPDAILKRNPETVSARLKEATRKRAPEPKAAPKKAAAVETKPVVDAAPVVETKAAAEVINSAPSDTLMAQPDVVGATAAAAAPAPQAPVDAVAVVAVPVEAAAPKTVDVKLPPLGQFRVYLGEFTFARGQKALGEADLERLSEILQPLLNRQVQGTFLVEGYASVDTKRTLKGDLNNMVLSLERANALEEGLKFMGVESDRIRVQALGQTNPHKLAGNRPRAVLWLIQ